MKKILLLGLNNTLGGANCIIVNLINEIKLINNNFQFDFLLPPGEVKFKNLLPLDSIIFEKKGSLFNFFKYMKSIKDILLRNDYDYIWINTSSACDIIPIKVAKKNKKIKIIAHSHSTEIESSSFFKLYLLKFLHRLNFSFFNNEVDYKFSCGEKAADWLFGTQKDVFFVKNGINTDKFKFDSAIRFEMRKNLNLQHNDFVFVHVGRFTQVKNHNFLIDVFSNLNSNSNNNYKLLLVGSGPLDMEIKEKVNKLNLADKVLFLGDRNDVNHLLSASDVFLLPSFFEGFPITLIEAQAAGLPCVISDTISSEVKLTDLVHFCDINCIETWTEKLSNLNIPKDRLIFNCRIKEQGYDTAIVAKKLEGFFYE